MTQLIAAAQVTQPHPETTVQDYTIYDQTVWEALWPKISANPVIPAVDFKTDMVVGKVFMVNRGGSSLRIIRVDQDDAEIKVHVEVTSPASHCMTFQMLSYPYHFVKIPRSTLPVTFVTTQVTKSCN